MKNINLAPPSHRPVKGVRGNKSLIFVFLFLLLLSFVCFPRFVPLGRHWQDKFAAKIGLLLGTEKSKKTEKTSVDKRSPEGEKGFKHKSEKQGAIVNDEVGMGKGDLISEEKNKEAVGIDIKGNEASIKAGNDIVVEVIEEKPVSTELDKKIIPGEIEKEPVLAKAETRKEGGEEEKTEEIESSAETASNYYIQVCSCVIKENADKTFRKLGDQGYIPIMKEIVRQVRMHNIYTGDFEKKSEAVRLLDRLKGDGFDSVLLPSSGGRYKLRITSCFYMESAKKVIKRLDQLGYKTNIRKEFIPTKMYAVLVGNFKSIQEAEAASEELIKKGYPRPILKRNPQT